MKKHPTNPGQRRREAAGSHAFCGRGVCGFVLCAVLVMTSGCVTKKVWTWAGEGKYTFLPSNVTSLGLSREEGRADRLFVRIDTAHQMLPPEDGSRGEGEYYVFQIPSDWKERPRVLVPDDVQPGNLQLKVLLEAKLTPAFPAATVASLSPVSLRAAARFPALDAAPYAFIERPPGMLFVYGADTERGGWIRLSSLITGQVISAPAPKFNYAVAVVATPATAAVDVVGVAIYAILWPLWISLDFGYGDGDDDDYRPDGRDQQGRARRELEKPRRTTEEPEVAPFERVE